MNILKIEVPEKYYIFRVLKLSGSVLFIPVMFVIYGVIKNHLGLGEFLVRLLVVLPICACIVFYVILKYSTTFYSFLLYSILSYPNKGKAAEIDCTYVNTGNPIDVDSYVKSKETIATRIGSFFSDGGFIKYNPLK